MKTASNCGDSGDRRASRALYKAAALYSCAIAWLALRARLTPAILVERAQCRLETCSEQSATVRDKLSKVIEREHESTFAEVRDVLNDISKAGGWSKILSGVDEDTRISLQVGMRQLGNKIQDRPQ